MSNNESKKEAINESQEESTQGSGMSRRTFLKTSGVVIGAAASTGVFTSALHAQGEKTIKFGLLEDRSGNFALFGLPKYSGTQLAIKEINEGFMLATGPTGPGGVGIKGDSGIIYDDIDDILVKSGDEQLFREK